MTQIFAREPIQFARLSGYLSIVESMDLGDQNDGNSYTLISPGIVAYFRLLSVIVEEDHNKANLQLGVMHLHKM